MRELMATYRRSFGVPDQERTRLAKEVWKIALDELWLIPVISNSPASQGRPRDQEQRGERPRAPLEQRGERQPAHRPHGDLVLQELSGRRGLERAPSPQRLASTTFLSSVRTAWPARNRPEYWPEDEYTEAASVSMTRTS